MCFFIPPTHTPTSLHSGLEKWSQKVICGKDPTIIDASFHSMLTESTTCNYPVYILREGSLVITLRRLVYPLSPMQLDTSFGYNLVITNVAK